VSAREQIPAPTHRDCLIASQPGLRFWSGERLKLLCQHPLLELEYRWRGLRNSSVTLARTCFRSSIALSSRSIPSKCKQSKTMPAIARYPSSFGSKSHLSRSRANSQPLPDASERCNELCP